MSLARVQQISISLDGFATGEGQTLDAPFGHAGERLHEWMFATRTWRQRVGEPGGSGGVDDAFLQLHDAGIGAEIMGAGKFGPPGWHEDPQWKGWWGEAVGDLIVGELSEQRVGVPMQRELLASPRNHPHAPGDAVPEHLGARVGNVVITLPATG